MSMLLNTPHFQETLNAAMCGPAALKIVLDYFDTPMTEKELAKLCGTKKGFGTTGKQMVAAAKLLGFKAIEKRNASFKDIERCLRRGVPPIVNWFTPGRWEAVKKGAVPDGHNSVVCGLTRTHIVLEDPELGTRRRIEKKEFMRVWFDFDVDVPKKQSDLIIRRLIIIEP